MRSCLSAFAAVSVMSVTLAAQQQQTPPPTTTGATQQQGQAQGRAGGGGGRGTQTPEQREAAAKEAYDREAALPRPIPARDSVWIEELTYLEVRDAMKAGKTTALVMAGSTEQNGPYMSGGKHQYAIKLVGEAIARKLGNALIAPIIPIEAGNPDNKYLEWGSIYFTPETFQAVVRDIATSLKGMGFTTVILMGDSGGNQGAMKAVAEALTTKYPDAPQRFIFIPEYYDYSSVQKLVQSSGIPEKIEIGASQGSDGLHEEYGIDALMALYDPKTIRLEQRTKAKRETINGVSLLPLSKTLEMAKKIVELRTKLTVDAIAKALAAK
jgi:creatinine amidohydrolase/Fe(II)-dependent formamide hydrolase-like protein